MNRLMCVGACAGAIAFGGAANGQGLDPRGVFFHEYSGTDNGTEWVTIWDKPGTDRYEFSDLRGAAPFSGVIGSDGSTTWDTGATGTGVFDSRDHANFDLMFEGNPFGLELWRAPGTTADFITRIESAENGDTGLSGTWSVQIDRLDPITGAVLNTKSETLTVEVVGTTFRMTELSGVMHQGVFETQTSVGFRAISPDDELPGRFRSFNGSEVSRNKNTLGDLRLSADGLSFEAVFLSENRPGRITDKTPSVRRYVATRVPSPGSAAVVSVAGVFGMRRRR